MIDQFRYIKPSISERRFYFEKSRDRIARYNISTLFLSSWLSLLLLTFFILFSPFIVKGWKPTIEYYVMFPLLIVFGVISFFYKKREVLNPGFVQIISVTFYCLMLANFILISVFPYPEDPETFFAFFILILPVLLIIKQYQVLIISLIFGAANIVLTIMLKSDVCIAHDVFATIVAILFSQAISLPLFGLRLARFYSLEQLLKISSTDHLAGISTKAVIETKAKAFIRTKLPPKWALVMIDIDDFKKINDVYGHTKGDLVISMVGKELQTIICDSITPGRIGGDEFLILFEDFSSREELIEVFENIRKRFSSYCNDSYGINVTISIGIYIGNDKTDTTYSQAFADADQALYTAKARGKNTIVVF